MWYNGTVTAARKLRIAYNHSLCRLFGIPENNSASEMFVQLNNLKNLELVVRRCSMIYCYVGSSFIANVYCLPV